MTIPGCKRWPRAASAGFGKETIIVPSLAGSGPVYLFTDELGLPVSTGPGLNHPDNRMHAPNENIRLEDVTGAVLCAAELLERASRL